MPAFRNSTVIQTMRDIKAFLNLEIGITRGPIPSLKQTTAPKMSGVSENTSSRTDSTKQVDQLSSQNNAEFRPSFTTAKDTKINNVRPENIVWIFGTARTGSTWLGSMMAEFGGHSMWNEPLVGDLFGHLYYIRGIAHIDKRSKDFILGSSHKESWLNSIRTFVLNEAITRFPEVTKESYLVIKEPNGSLGSPLLMEALPESRMVFLIRDPRDVVASLLDINKKEAWLHEWKGKDSLKEATLADPTADTQPDIFVKTRANWLLRAIENVKQAYEAHRGPKVLVRYEDLRIDTLATMKRIYSTLEIPVNEVELSQIVEKHSWENIPQEEKGAGKFNRKAAPGSWREDLTPGQVGIVEQTTAPILKEFYPD